MLFRLTLKQTWVQYAGGKIFSSHRDQMRYFLLHTLKLCVLWACLCSMSILILTMRWDCRIVRKSLLWVGIFQHFLRKLISLYCTNRKCKKYEKWWLKFQIGKKTDEVDCIHFLFIYVIEDKFKYIISNEWREVVRWN